VERSHGKRARYEGVSERRTNQDIVCRKVKKKMATKDQIAANRKNAKLSTGPSTDAGKARSALNSTRHGLLGKFHLVGGEDAQEFSEFEERARFVLKPEGAVEEYYVDLWVGQAWRLNRHENVISVLLVNKGSNDDLSFSDLLSVYRFISAETGRRFDELPEVEKFLEEAAGSDDNSQATRRNKFEVGSEAEVPPAVYEELSSLEALILEQLADRLCKDSLTANIGNTEQPPADPDGTEGERSALCTKAAINTMARAFACKRNEIALALRYRTKIERSRDNALHELQRFQAARLGRVVAAPDIIDVNVNFTGKEEQGD
jgi:hypothetical protein